MFHLRYTPYDISGYTFDFLKSYDKYIVAQEDLDSSGNPLLHYHILIEDVSLGGQTLRNSVKASLKIPSTGKGKNNKYYAIVLDWKDPGYICKHDNILVSKGYTEKQILDYVISGKNKYLDKVKAVELSGLEVPATLSPKKEVKIPFQQYVITAAAADWYNLKREGNAHIEDLKEIVCKAMRERSKGINPYLVRDLAYAVLFDDLDHRDYVLSKITI